MPCYTPLEAWQLPGKTANGKARIKVLKQLKNSPISRAMRAAFLCAFYKPMTLPCGRCIGCRLERSRQWAVRLVHENQLHESSSFLTLTYEKMPEGESLNVRDIQLFLKRLRKSRGSAKLRFFQCGEYGCDDPAKCRNPRCSHGRRPHHHMILFGEDFRDRRLQIQDSQSGLPQFWSEELEKLWGHGMCTIGEMTFESAAYVARYSLKKVLGDKAEAHYQGRKPEYVTMSRRPGIGAGWLKKFGFSNTYNHDSVVMREREMLPPKFYDKLLEKADPVLYERIKQGRRPEVGFFENPETTDDRLFVRRTVKERTISSALKRGIE